MTDVNIPDFIPVLSHGNHHKPEQGACVMEMVSFLAGEEFSDKPKCVAYKLRVEAISINDLVSDDNRNKIALMIPRFMGTSSLDGQKFADDYYVYADTFKEEHGLDAYHSVSVGIRNRFHNDTGDARLSNEGYDQIGIDYLNGLLDLADKHLGRTNVTPLSEYVPAMKSHPSQVNA